MGDPETEVVVPRIKSDLLALFAKVQNQELNTINIEFETYTATTVMCVAGGYPNDYKKGDEITGWDNIKNVLVFHAGTANKDGKIVTNGGRVVALTGIGTDIKDALTKSNQAAQTLSWTGKFFRKDIGLDLL